MNPSFSAALSLATSPAIVTPAKTANYRAARKAAVSFEGEFISQMLSPMFKGVSPGGMFGGGQGEAMFRSLMIDQFGKSMAQRGGFGLASEITRALLSHQEIAS
jgi:Rod binding domain-containing protein